VLEVGSYVENGSLRDILMPVKTYIGVDWRAGPGVDQVCQAKDLKFEEPFTAVVSASMLEHDAEWWLSIPAMLECVNADGILILTWGAALNPPHYHETAIDGKFHALPVGRVLAQLALLAFYVHEFHYEYRLPYLDASDRSDLDRGCVGLVGFWDRSVAPGDREIDELLEEDR
jgi:hypothetical protein